MNIFPTAPTENHLSRAITYCTDLGPLTDGVLILGTLLPGKHLSSRWGGNCLSAYFCYTRGSTHTPLEHVKQPKFTIFNPYPIASSAFLFLAFVAYFFRFNHFGGDDVNKSGKITLE